MKARRIPVWLLTGYLGSGKTTLLAAWLRDPALADAALVMNEIGEVGLDDRLLASAVDSAALVANACICCTGMPGLEQALADLWWDRLHRRRPDFGSVIIETTGLADPRPVVSAFREVPLLRERYELAGVFATASATAGLASIGACPEAQAQIVSADAIIVTKADQVAGEPLVAALRELNPRAGIAMSAHASLGWAQARALASAVPASAMPPVSNRHEHHRHDAIAAFVPMDEPLTAEALHERVDALRDSSTRRIKGVVRFKDGTLQTVQWALGDREVAVSPFQGQAPALGLTCIGRGQAGGTTPPGSVEL